jgi:hypothetical protein
MTTDLSLPADKKTGQATFYTFWNSAGVSCNPMKCPDDGFCAAIPLTYMQPSGSSKASCGKCIKVVYQQKAAIVRVMDTCPECPDTNIDLADKLFTSLIGDLGKGRVQVQWGFVDCNSSGSGGSNGQTASGSSNGQSVSATASSSASSASSAAVGGAVAYLHHTRQKNSTSTAAGAAAATGDGGASGGAAAPSTAAAAASGGSDGGSAPATAAGSAAATSAAATSAAASTAAAAS